MTKSRSTPPKHPAPKAGRQPDAAPATPITAAGASDDNVFHTRGLLEACRTRWQYGEWEAIARLTEAEIAQDEDRARVAALVAAAHAHLMDRPAARLFALRAAEWGCDRRIIVRLLLSGAANTLGRCATILKENEAGEAWFREAIELVEPRADAVLLGHTRQVRETARLGLMEEARQIVDRALHGARAERLPALQSDVAFLRQQITAMGPDIQKTGRSKRPDVYQAPQVVIVAGVPRSGSTWLYNATRLLIEANGHSVYACWNGDYSPSSFAGHTYHVVKVHDLEDLSFPYDTILTTNRPIIERLASLIRMGWLEQSEEAVKNAYDRQNFLYEFWRDRTDLEIKFADIRNHPEKIVHLIAATLQIGCNARMAAAVVREIDALPMPDPGQPHDPLSQMHPGHRSDGSRTAEIAEWISEFLTESDQDRD